MSFPFCVTRTTTPFCSSGIQLLLSSEYTDPGASHWPLLGAGTSGGGVHASSPCAIPSCVQTHSASCVPSIPLPPWSTETPARAGCSPPSSQPPLRSWEPWAAGLAFRVSGTRLFLLYLERRPGTASVWTKGAPAWSPVLGNAAEYSSLFGRFCGAEPLYLLLVSEHEVSQLLRGDLPPFSSDHSVHSLLAPCEHRSSGHLGPVAGVSQ